MDNIFKMIIIAVGIMFTAVLIGVGVMVFGKGSDLTNIGMSKLDAETATLVNLDKKIYDNATMSGSSVIDCINKYKDTDMYVVVSTRDGNVYCYNNMFAPDSADAATIADDFKAVNAMLWELGGWPPNCWGAGSTPVAIEPKLADGVDAESTPRLGNLQAAPKGSYDATSTSSTPGYLSSNASFVSSLQMDRNNDIRCITFIQK